MADAERQEASQTKEVESAVFAVILAHSQCLPMLLIVPVVQDNGCLDELVDACWEFVLELKKGRQGLTHTRSVVADMVVAMLNWGSPALGFIRRVCDSA